MAEYRVEVTRAAYRDLDRLSPDIGGTVLTAIRGLTSDPRPRQCRKLSGSDNSYRLRVGDYRVLYEVDDNGRLVTVYAVGHRRDIYRRRR